MIESNYIKPSFLEKFNKSTVSYNDITHSIFDDSKRNITLVIGEYGTGKTRFIEELEKLSIRNDKEYLLLRSRDINNDITIIDEISNYHSSDVIVLIDALDELIYDDVLIALFEYIDDSNAQFILSCRSTYLSTFIDTLSNEDYQQPSQTFFLSKNINLVELQKFKREEAILFLKNSNVSEKDINNLSNSKIWENILTHPLWLTVITHIIHEKVAFNPNNLWDILSIYIANILKKSKHPKSYLDDLFQDISLTIISGKQVSSNMLIGIEQDILTIIDNSTNHLTFRNQIFLDYFLILKIIDEYENDQLDILERYLLSNVQIELLSEGIKNEGHDDILKKAKKYSNGIKPLPNSYLGSNVANLFMQRKYTLNKLMTGIKSFHSGDFSKKEISSLKLNNIDFKNATFAGANISNTLFNNCNFEGVDFGDKVGILDLSLYGNSLAIVTHEGNIITYVVENNELIEKNRISKPGTTVCTINQKEITIGNREGYIQILDIELSPVTEPLKCHTDKVMDILSHSNFIMSCSCDGTIAIYDKAQSDIRTGKQHSDIAHGIEYDSILEYVITASYDGTIAKRNIRSMHLDTLQLSNKSLYTCKLSPDNKYLAVAGYGGAFYILDYETFDVIQEPNVHPSTIWSIEWLDSKTISLVGWEDYICLYNVEEKECSQLEYDCYNSKIVSNLEYFIASSAKQRSLTLFDKKTKQQLQSKEVSKKDSIVVKDVTINACYGLADLRIKYLQDLGVTVTNPRRVTKETFHDIRKRKKITSFFKKEPLDPKHLTKILDINTAGITTIEGGFSETNKNEDLLVKLAQIKSHLKKEDLLTDEVMSDISKIENELQHKEYSEINVDLLLQRLSNLEGASTLLILLVKQIIIFFTVN